MKNVYSTEEIPPHSGLWKNKKVREGVSFPKRFRTAEVILQSLHDLNSGLILPCSKRKPDLVGVWRPVESFPYLKSPGIRSGVFDG